MKKVVLITNPRAGSGAASAALRDARRTLWGWPLATISPNSLEELRMACATICPTRHEAVIVIGGDGTFQKTLHAMSLAGALPQVPLLPFPTGTANDLAAELGIRADWEQVQSLLDNRSRQKIDCLFVNGIPFTTLAGVGLGSSLTEEYNGRRKTSPLFAKLSQRLKAEVYVALAAKTLIFGSSAARRTKQSLVVECEGFRQTLKVSALFVCNQPRLGGQITVSRECRNDDGFFQVSIVPHAPKWSLLHSLWSLRAGILPPELMEISARELKIKGQRGYSIQVFGDGETLIEAPELRFTIAPASLTVYRQGAESVLPGLTSNVVDLAAALLERAR